MSYDSTAEPIKIGYLFDFKLPDGFPQESRDDLVLPFELVFQQGLEQGLIDRPSRSSSGRWRDYRRGPVKAVIDAYGELVDEGAWPCSARPSPTTAYRRAKRSSSGSTCRRSA